MFTVNTGSFTPLSMPVLKPVENGSNLPPLLSRFNEIQTSTKSNGTGFTLGMGSDDSESES